MATLGPDAFTERIAELRAKDLQFAAAQPDDVVTAALQRPDVRLAEVVATVLTGYADRPALGQRAIELVKDPASGATRQRFRPRFDTITYRELGRRVDALLGSLVTDPKIALRQGDRVCLLGFTSIDYTTVDVALMRLGAVGVPLHTSASSAQLAPIVAETQPTVIASSIEAIDDAVELAITAHSPRHVMVFDYDRRDDYQRHALERAEARLSSQAGLTIEPLTAAIARGAALPRAQIKDKSDPLTLIVYTSGSTGAPKGAMYHEQTVTDLWRNSAMGALAAVTLNFMPMSHMMGRGALYSALGNGGTAYFAAKSDLSTFFEDLALVRPTQVNFVPRVWDSLFAKYRAELDRCSPAGSPSAEVEAALAQEFRENQLGGRIIMATSASASLAPATRRWVETRLGLLLIDGYGSTESGPIALGGRIMRPPIVDYKLLDVPELGYFTTDSPNPRGELLIKSSSMFPGYYRRPDATAEVFDSDGYYRTGDIVAELGPDEVAYLDRRNNVLKLSQGEFIAVGRLESLLATCPSVRQIFIHGNSSHPHLVAVVVPTEEALTAAGDDLTSIKHRIGEEIRTTAKMNSLQPYEIPRGLLIEKTPFSPGNELLTGIGKPARLKLKQHYGDRLEQLYIQRADEQSARLQLLHRSGATQPTLRTVIEAAAVVLEALDSEPTAGTKFTDVGGDSLSALSFATVLREVFGVDVPVSVIVDPTHDLGAVARFIDAELGSTSERSTWAQIHGADADEVHAEDLRLEKFLPAATLAAGHALPASTTPPRTILITGATGFLGRYLVLEWLAKVNQIGGTVVCLVRAENDAAARARLDGIFDSGDVDLTERYRLLSAGHLDVIAGDKTQPDLGLSRRTWDLLAESVDLIVDSGALVNHRLPYRELFGPNVVGTAELIRLALTDRRKHFVFVSTGAVADQMEPGAFTEYADIRQASPSRALGGTYANGYATSKWAAEVLLREAHDVCGLSVTVFRCDMIMASIRHRGQLNIPDVFVRLLISVLATGLAPESFCELSTTGQRQRDHFDGLSVDFIAEAITTLGVTMTESFSTYHVMNPHDDGIGLDVFIDWIEQAGYPVTRIARYQRWFDRLEVALSALPERLRRASLSPVLTLYDRPRSPMRSAMGPTERFRAAILDGALPGCEDIPHVTRELIAKYVADLEAVDLV